MRCWFIYQRTCRLLRLERIFHLVNKTAHIQTYKNINQRSGQSDFLKSVDITPYVVKKRINIALIEDFYIKNDTLTEDFYVFSCSSQKKVVPFATDMRKREKKKQKYLHMSKNSVNFVAIFSPR